MNDRRSRSSRHRSRSRERDRRDRRDSERSRGSRRDRESERRRPRSPRRGSSRDRGSRRGRRSRSRERDDKEKPEGGLGDLGGDDDEEDEEYQKRLMEQMAGLEEEEEDEEKIKEEARKRREAILKKVTGSSRVETRPAVVEPPELRLMQQAAEEGNGHHGTNGTAVPMETDADKKDESKPEEEKKEEPEDDGLDMFSDSPVVKPGMMKGTGAAGGVEGEELGNDNYNDEEGYYNFRLNEILSHDGEKPPQIENEDGELVDPPPPPEYEVLGKVGSGVYAGVLKCRVKETGAFVAVKILRENPSKVFEKSGRSEIEVLRLLMGMDPAGDSHCVKLLDEFVYRGHVCLVFELLKGNLREHLKKQRLKRARDSGGYSIKLLQIYAKQMLRALALVRSAGLIHADIKPDNVLVKSVGRVELADFGSAVREGELQIGVQICSLFYRAPEVLLGLKLSSAVDMWAMGCTLFEMFTGQICFRGNNENEMLREMQEMQGNMPKKLKKGVLSGEYFDTDGVFVAVISVPNSDRTSAMRKVFAQPSKPIQERMPDMPDMDGSEVRILREFRSLLSKMLALDPDHRPTPDKALAHPFFTTT